MIDKLSGPELIISELKVYPVKSLGGISLETAELSPKGFVYDRYWMIVSEDGDFITQRKIPKMAAISVELDTEALILSATGYETLAIPLKEPLQTNLTDVTIHGECSKGIDEGDTVSSWLTEVLGQYKNQNLRLMRFPKDHLRPVEPDVIGEGRAYTGFADGYPVLVVSEESLQELNTRLLERGKDEVPMSRFRPNIVVKGDKPFIEDELAFMTFNSGARIELVKQCTRCPVTTVDQVTGEKPDSKEPLATLATFRRVKGGVVFGHNAIVSKSAQLTVGERVLAEVRS